MKQTFGDSRVLSRHGGRLCLPANRYPLRPERCAVALPDIWTTAPCPSRAPGYLDTPACPIGLPDIWTARARIPRETIGVLIEQANLAGGETWYRCAETLHGS